MCLEFDYVYSYFTAMTRKSKIKHHFVIELNIIPLGHQLWRLDAIAE